MLGPARFQAQPFDLMFVDDADLSPIVLVPLSVLFFTSDVVRPLNLMLSILAMSSSPVHCQDLNSHLR